MPYIEYACEGRLLFRTEASDGNHLLPRINEIVVIDDTPYQVLDVEYWARRVGAGDRRSLWATVYLTRLAQEEWNLRAERRLSKPRERQPPVRY